MSTDLIGRAYYTWTLNCACFSVVALGAYDYVLTFPDEVRLIWPARWSVVKILFFLTRYLLLFEIILGFLGTIEHHEQLNQARAWLSFAGIIVAEIIMGVRVYAIWGAKREVLAFLVVVVVGCTIFGSFWLEKRLRSLEDPAGVNGTFYTYVVYVLIMSLEFIVAAMTFWKWFSEWRQCESSLAKTMFEDSLRYFVCLFAISSANVIAVTTANAILPDSLYLFQRVLHSILSARILLNIREVAHLENGREISDMSFAVNPQRNYAADVSLSRVGHMEQRNDHPNESIRT